MAPKKVKRTKRTPIRTGVTALKTAASTKKGTGAGKIRRSANDIMYPREGGPRKWLLPVLEEAYTRLAPREEPQQLERPGSLAAGAKAFRSKLQPGGGVEVLATIGQNLWLDRVREYRARQAAVMAVPRAPAMGVMPRPGAVVAGQKNWRPLGPSVVLNGQAVGTPAVAGRVSGIAIAPGGQIVYAASANGGVFRSDDGGQSWRSLMDAFDVDPTNYAATSLACGAIAIDANDPNRVYVGTGEGDTDQMFRSGKRIVDALPAYRGIGPIRSDNGGATWNVESTAPGSPALAGKAFFALAVDPSNRENVVGATTEGLYQRVLQANGQAQWILRRPKMHSSVVVASSAHGTRFIAAEWGGKIWSSADGSQWSPLGSGFPVANVERISLAVQKLNPDLVYAFVSDAKGLVLGVYRLNNIPGAWKKIANPPDVLPKVNGQSQGDYDLAIAVDPADANLIYLGGSYYSDQHYWPASVWRCRVEAAGTNFRFVSGESIGIRAHADVHVVLHSPADPNELWMGCDGGVFLNRAPKTSDNFGSRNNGLACLCCTFFAQHPSDPNTLFCGLQDNGTVRTRGGSVWKYVSGGDGGYCVVNWHDPRQVLVFANGVIYRTTDGTRDEIAWTPNEDFSWASMTEPIVNMPYNPARPEEAKIVALASGQEVHLSADFGATWPTTIAVPTTGIIYSLAFASSKRLFVGTSKGEVFRADRAAQAWTVTQLDKVAAGPLGLQGLVSDVAIDWADANLASVYIAFGGAGDARRVWHFDGTRWLARSGPAGAATGNLLDVEHNALVVDRNNPDHIYAGADIGVWHSADRGQHWIPLPNGLPDAPVFDLQIHPTSRLLRAATHGRGLYEFPLDPGTIAAPPV
jgi:photosystem II stability/assembly factor-like uncharacterized protein